MLGEQTEDYDDLDYVYSNCKLKSNLWNGRLTWANKTEAWKKMLFLEIDANEVSKEITVYNKIGLVSKKAEELQNNPVVELFVEAVREFKLLEPVIVDLRSKALKERHWKEIQSAIGKELDTKEMQYSLGDLVDMGMPDHSEEIHVSCLCPLLFFCRSLYPWQAMILT